MLTKSIWLFGLLAFLFAINACASQDPQITPQPATVEPATPTEILPTATVSATEAVSATPTPQATATQALPTPQASPTPIPSPTLPLTDIPLILDSLTVGLSAGNGFFPRLVAWDEMRQRVYLFNSGHFKGDGNTISLFNHATEQFTQRLNLRNRLPNETRPHAPLALQLDSYRPYLYALSGDQYGDFLANELFIINAETLTITDKIPLIRAVMVGPAGLYLVDDANLRLIDPETKTQKAEFPFPAELNVGPVTINPQSNRLYISYGPPWIIESFTLDTLQPAEQFFIQNEPLYLMPSAEPGSLTVIERAESQVLYHSYFPGQALLSSTNTISLANNVYGPFPVTHTDDSVYWAERVDYDFYLHRLNRQSLEREQMLSLPCLPEQLIIDEATATIYGPCSNPDSVLLIIDLASATVQTHYSAVVPVDGLAVPAEDRLYLLKNTGQLDEMKLSDHSLVASLHTDYNSLSAGPQQMGKLSLDAPRQRLYLDGPAVQIFNTETFTFSARLDTPGQLTPDPSSNRLYFTPPCKCRFEQCNTLVLSAQTLSGTQKLFSPAESLAADCVTATQLDVQNQILYTYNYNGIAGSNSGSYYVPFDVSERPRRLEAPDLYDISFGPLAFDPVNERVFVPRYRVVEGFLHRFDLDRSTDSVQEALELAGAFGQVAYSTQQKRLYNVQRFDSNALQVFDAELNLRSEIPLPNSYTLLAFDDEQGRLYLNDEQGEVLIVSTTGGQLSAPPPPDLGFSEATMQKLYLAPADALLRIFGGQIFQSNDEGTSWQLLNVGLPGKAVTSLAISPNFADDQTLFAGFNYYDQSGGVYRSQDGGQSWSPAMNGLSDMNIRQILFSPDFADDQTLYLLASKRGLYRSVDGGNSWESLAHTYQDEYGSATVNQIAISPNFAQDNLLFMSRANLWRSIDGGQNWQDTGIPGGVIAFDPNFSQSGLILNNGQWRSTDGGETWQAADSGRFSGYQTVTDLQIAPAVGANQNAYLLYQPDYALPFTLQRSVDGGQRWQSLAPEQAAELDFSAFTIHPDGDLYIGHKNGKVSRLSPASLTWLEENSVETE